MHGDYDSPTVVVGGLAAIELAGIDACVDLLAKQFYICGSRGLYKNMNLCLSTRGEAQGTNFFSIQGAAFACASTSLGGH
jgi:hypothetical protein